MSAGSPGSSYATLVDREIIFLAVTGLFIGSLVGVMAQVVPYSFLMLSGFGMTILAWRQEGGFDVVYLMLGLLFGSAFGNFAQVMPFGVTVFLAVVTGVMIWRTQGGGDWSSGPTSTIALILFALIAMNFLFAGTYQDMCWQYIDGNGLPVHLITGQHFDFCLSPGTSGYITAWQGCLQDCAITAFTFLGNSPLAFLLNGDFVGFITQFASGANSPFNFGPIFNVVATLITFAVASLLLVLGSGIGVEAQAATVGGQIQPNDAGSRLFQSLGIGWLLWVAVTGVVFSGAQWFQYIGFGLGGSGTVNQIASVGIIYLLLFTVYTYELYRQARTYL